MRMGAVIMAVTLMAAGCASNELGHIRSARLGQGDHAGFKQVRDQFEAGNPGVTLTWHEQVIALEPSGRTRIGFVHGHDAQGDPVATLSEPASSPVSVGDLVVLRAGTTLRSDRPVSLLVFEVEEPVSDDVPAVIRPDNDPRISDSPGGCATDADAYRRVALTWLPENGPYVYHGLNAHRVLISDSLTHYHPVDTGWDEFYLVQGTRPGAGIWISRETDLIERPDDVKEDDVEALLTFMPVESGDCVLLPRGTVHRGVGGVLVHVLAVPGFVPDNEISVDEYLEAVNLRLGLTGIKALPCHGCTSGAH